MIARTNVGDRVLHGIVLAGGEGRRLQRYVQEIGREALPKQYVNVMGDRSMLEHTFHRAEKLIPAERILTVISRRTRCEPRPVAKLLVALEKLLSCSPPIRRPHRGYCFRLCLSTNAALGHGPGAPIAT